MEIQTSFCDNGFMICADSVLDLPAQIDDLDCQTNNKADEQAELCADKKR